MHFVLAIDKIIQPVEGREIGLSGLNVPQFLPAKADGRPLAQCLRRWRALLPESNFSDFVQRIIFLLVHGAAFWEKHRRLPGGNAKQNSSSLAFKKIADRKPLAVPKRFSLH